MIHGTLAVMTLAVYWQTLEFEFVYDDEKYIVINRRLLAGLTADNFAWAFRTTYLANWHPLTWLSYLLDMSLYGDNPRGFHLTNVLWHTANVLLLFAVLCRMTGATWRSAFVAGVFAVHPLHVESVAWISERKDLLSTFFGLLAIASYVRYASRLQKRYYWCALIAFALSLLAKPTLVTLPFLLLLLDFWPLNRTRWQPASYPAIATRSSLPSPARQPSSPAMPRAADAPAEIEKPPLPFSRLCIEKIPFFVVTAISCVVAVFAQLKGGALQELERYSLTTRCANAVLAYVLYLKHTFWPSGLAAFYPHPGDSIDAWSVAGAALLLVAVTAWCVLAARKRPYLLVGWFWYLGTLVPMIGLMQVGLQQMADRYTYFPLIGFSLAVAWLVGSSLKHGPWRRLAFSMVALPLLIVMCVLAWRQAAFWRDSYSLFGRMLAVTENNHVAHNNLGYALQNDGRLQEAMAHYRRALEIDADFPFAHFNLGNALLQQEQADEAIRHYERFLSQVPDHQQAHYNMGVALEKKNRTQAAIRHYRQAPDVAAAHYNLALCLGRLGQLDEALEHYRAALRLTPDFAEAYFNLGNTLALRGEFTEAVSQFRQALERSPRFAAAHYNLATALQELGRTREAIPHYKMSLSIEPDSPQAHNSLGRLYSDLEGERKRAIEHFREAIRLDPDFAEAQVNLQRMLNQVQPDPDELPNGGIDP